MKGQRITKQRKRVLEAAISRRDHPSADQIYMDLRAEDPRISRGTVYRNLHLLVQQNELRHVKMPDADRFDWRAEPHYHLLCTGCGRVIDVPVPYRADLDAQISDQTGYRIAGHRMVFEGLCPECRREEPAT